MGRGRRGTTDQSQKKTRKSSRPRGSYMVVKPPEHYAGGAIYYLPEQMLAEMKRLNPKDVASALLSLDGN